MTGAPIIAPFCGQRAADDTGFDRLFFIGMNYWEVSRLALAVTPLRRRSGSTYGFAFDAFHAYLEKWVDRFPHPLRPAVRLARHEMRTLQHFDRLFTPTKALLQKQRAFFEAEIDYLPIGVDAVNFGSVRDDRPISTNGYGRQPAGLNQALSDRMNGSDSSHLHHWTDHMHIASIVDPVRHRQLFWRQLSASKIALAYAHEAYDPLNRFDCSLVGQRWFEAAAAGCLIAGQRPSASETRELFAWEDALVDLPPDVDDAVDALIDLLADEVRLAAARTRNRKAALERHDWRHRIAELATHMDLERSDTFNAELDRTTAAVADIPALITGSR